MMKSFKHVDIFPLISRLITDITDKNSSFVGHSELTDSLLANVEGMALVMAAEVNNKLGIRGTASNMVAWFSKRYSEGENEFIELIERRKVDKTWAYRSLSKTRTVTPLTPVLPQDVDSVAMEGNPKMVTHIKRERNSKFVKEKLKRVQATTGQLECEVCGFNAEKVFPDLLSPVVEVHHRTLLSKYDGEAKTTLADLSILCPTCHRAIHRSGDLTVEEFRSKYFSDGLKYSAV